MITVAVCFFSAGTTYGERVDMFACHRSNQIDESRPVAGINSKANKKRKEYCRNKRKYRRQKTTVLNDGESTNADALAPLPRGGDTETRRFCRLGVARALTALGFRGCHGLFLNH